MSTNENQKASDKSEGVAGIGCDDGLGDGTPLYQRTTKESEVDGDRGALMKQVWSPTPWMLDVFVGSDDEKRRQIRSWCNRNLGNETIPYGEYAQGGAWREGNVTIHGWTWYGFKSENFMKMFETQFPSPNAEVSDGAGRKL